MDNIKAPPMADSLVLSWMTRFVLYVVTAVSHFACRPDGTINRRLLTFFDPKVFPYGKPLKGVRTADISVDPARNLWFRLFIPTESPHHTSLPLPVIVFFHGGGFAFQSADSIGFEIFCRRMARSISAIVVSVNYRLSPEHRFPAQYDDGFDALRFLDEQNFDGFPADADLKRCFLAGDSAGANLAHHVACRASKAEFREVKVIGLISIVPFFGGEERTESEIRLVGAPLVSMRITDWLWKAFLPEGSDRDHEAVNVSGPNAADITSFNHPATLVLVGGFDPLQDWQRRYYEWLRRSGKEAYLIEYPNAFHTFYLFPELPESSLLLSEVKNFVQHQSKSNINMK
ncbi:PREDICTED: probable carboxylesterase 18 [Nelumbo nucifera]|uniref:Alpha/beta hydrolase fold-3 domain-containing protein n=2 Tax=Nelumbo nucifera TaxID=4432 RepID=A0A822Z690_NELNU|nr:PREDICTED: probable carboxylesterase 18 [Nelumbo nucifera]DAD38985.1 TPA_asm: hypothetical protein HUJ06_013308 [Nelumbo nucifera]